MVPLPLQFGSELILRRQDQLLTAGKDLLVAVQDGVPHHGSILLDAKEGVELYDFADRPLEVRWNGHALPYRVFSKDQRVSHAAIIENKRLGHALSIVKAQQDVTQATKVMTNSEKTGYKKGPRAIYGPNFVEKTRSRAAVEMPV